MGLDCQHAVKDLGSRLAHAKLWIIRALSRRPGLVGSATLPASSRGHCGCGLSRRATAQLADPTRRIYCGEHGTTNGNVSAYTGVG